MRYFTTSWRTGKVFYYLLCLTLAFQIVLSVGLRGERAVWSNVPPAPTKLAFTASFLGDQALAYRVVGNLLQNFGSSGGRFYALGLYNMDNVATWLRLGEELDNKSLFLPYLASNYYGATQHPEKLGSVVEYLADVGDSYEGRRWFFLVQAVFLARFQMQDLDLAYKVSLRLPKLYTPDRPAYILEIPAFIKNAQGAKEEARDMLLDVYEKHKHEMKNEEINALFGYMCEQVLTPAQARLDPHCLAEPLPSMSSSKQSETPGEQ